ncbi:hypothetical protein [Xanthomonas citri]|nr:hypothetical protein [Xanthomonas citri]
MNAHRDTVTAVAALQQPSHHAVAQDGVAWRALLSCKTTSSNEGLWHIVRFEVVRQYVVLALTSSRLASAAAGWRPDFPAQAVSLAALFSPIAAMAAARFNRAGMREQAMGAAPVAANQPQTCPQSARACLRVCDANARQRRRQRFPPRP